MAGEVGDNGIQGESVLIAKIPIDKVNPSELQDLVEKVPGAEVVTETTATDEPAYVKIFRNVIKFGNKKK